MESTFWSDGYRDGYKGLSFSPPDSHNGSDVLAQEYAEGYAEGQGQAYYDQGEAMDVRCVW